MHSKSQFIHYVDASAAKKFSTRQAVTSPIKHFELSDFEIDSGEFLQEIAPTYQDLPYDYYDVASRIEEVIRSNLPALFKLHESNWLEAWKDLGGYHREANPPLRFWQPLIDDKHILNEIEQFQPFRRRSCFRYLVRSGAIPYQWRIEEVGTPVFSQQVADLRSRDRKFVAPPQSVYRSQRVQQLIGVICQLVSQAPSVFSKRFRVTMHQILTYANRVGGGEPSPEGIHQDGVSFIVSALLIKRENVRGGVSEIYYSRKTRELAFQHELKPGEGIMQSDVHHDLWHDVTPIYAIDKDRMAYRSILGLDVEIMG